MNDLIRRVATEVVEKRIEKGRLYIADIAGYLHDSPLFIAAAAIVTKIRACGPYCAVARVLV